MNGPLERIEREVKYRASVDKEYKKGWTNKEYG